MRFSKRIVVLSLTLCVLPMPALATPKKQTTSKPKTDTMAQARQQAVLAMKDVFGNQYVNGIVGMQTSKSFIFSGSAAQLAQSGKFAEADKEFGKALTALDSEGKSVFKNKLMENYMRSNAYCGRSECQFQLKNNTKALEFANKAVQAYPDYSTPYQMRAKIFKSLGKNKSFAEDSAKALNNSALPKFMMTELANHKAMKSSMKVIESKVDQKATGLFVGGSQALKSSPLLKHYEKALTLLDQKKYVPAIDEFSAGIELCADPKQKAIFKDPNGVNALLAVMLDGRAYCQCMRKEYELAAGDLTESLKLFPNRKEAYINRGKCYQMLGKTAEANADFAKAKKAISVQTAATKMDVLKD